MQMVLGILYQKLIFEFDLDIRVILILSKYTKYKRNFSKLTKYLRI